MFVKVESWDFQYFSFFCKNLSTSSFSLTKIYSISCTCKYSVLHVADLQTFKRWLATHLILPSLMSLLWIQNLFLKLLAESIYCSAPICNPCPDLKSLPRFVISLAPICNLCPDLKSLCPDLKSLHRFVIFLPRFEIP